MEHKKSRLVDVALLGNDLVLRYQVHLVAPLLLVEGVLVVHFEAVQLVEGFLLVIFLFGLQGRQL